MTSRNLTLPAARAAVPAATRATYVAFIGSGFTFANWAARIPQVRDRFHLSSAQLGFVLLAIAVGSLVALPLAGVIVHRFGSRRTVAAMAVLAGVGLAIAALGYLVGVPPVLAGLALFGFANGAWDVAMNVQGAAVERRLGRAIMPRFHAGWSVGTVAGALLGAGMVALAVPVTAHLLTVSVVSTLAVAVTARGFLPDTDADSAAGHPEPAPAHTAALRRWLESRTLLIGVIVLAFTLAEGAGNDWIAVSLIDGYQVPAAVSTVGFAVFLAAMTAGRWFGPAYLDRYGRVTVLRVLAALAVGGIVLFSLGPWTPLAFAGAVLWGVGASLGFPVGMSAAADEPAAAAGRVSVVASIGYCAFLAGPPVIGFLGEHVTVLHALLLVAGLLSLACVLTGAVRPLPPGDDQGVRSSPRAS